MQKCQILSDNYQSHIFYLQVIGKMRNFTLVETGQKYITDQQNRINIYRLSLNR